MPNLLRVCDVAQRLNVSKWTVYGLVADGKLRPVRLLTGRLLFTELALEQAITAAEGPPAEAQPVA